MRELGDKSDWLAGSLLLAHPKLRDPNFARSVVLLSLHNAEGAMGVVLNRPLGKTLADLGPEFRRSELAKVPVYSGGPVNPEQLILVAWQTASFDGTFKLYFGLDPQKLRELMGETSLEVRAFLGYSGWSAGQLEGEMKGNTWLVSPVPAELLGQLEGVNLWKRIVGGLSAEWRVIVDEPEDPSQN
ncbi:MAG TPA: YqgE/AlgH family protein [Opitutaceae bacterium]|nr:YqgE/AlgH family protein [Opitutaceae bacterium]